MKVTGRCDSGPYRAGVASLLPIPILSDSSVYRARMVLDLKPAMLIKGAPMFAQFGDIVVVTENDARRLGKRRLEEVV